MSELTYKVRLRIYKDDLVFGPGIARLMQGIEETGSMSEACRSMGMAYSKGWKIIKRAQQELGYPLIEGTRGGANGGKMILTAQGKDFLDHYLSFEEAVEKAAQDLFQKHMTGWENPCIPMDWSAENRNVRKAMDEA